MTKISARQWLREFINSVFLIFVFLVLFGFVIALARHGIVGALEKSPGLIDQALKILIAPFTLAYHLFDPAIEQRLLSVELRFIVLGVGILATVILFFRRTINERKRRAQWAVWSIIYFIASVWAIFFPRCC